MEEFIIRSATHEDLSTLFQFEQGVITTERQFDPTIKSGHINYYNLKEMIQAANVEVAVAETDNKLIACGYARIEENSKLFFNYEKYAYLGFMYVVPEHRGKGVINKIIDYLKTWVSMQNINEMRLEVYAGNEAAIKAYERIGFSQLIIEMRMPVQ